MLSPEPISPQEEVPGVDEIDVQAVAGLAAEDQQMADAKGSARALAAFWENLPKKMGSDLRGLLTMRWQEYHLQNKWTPSFEDFFDDDEEDDFS
jgi:hypothetical protein